MKAYCEPCQPSKMKRFVKIVNGFQSLTIFAKRFILDVWQCFEYTSDNGIYAFDLDNTHLFMGTSRNFKEYFRNLYRHKKSQCINWFLFNYLSICHWVIYFVSIAVFIFKFHRVSVFLLMCVFRLFLCFFVSVFFSFDL